MIIYDKFGDTSHIDGKGLTYTYTDDGRLVTRTNARGIVTTYTYDDWGQLLSVDYADATPDIAYAYDPATGRLATMGDFAWEYLPGSHLKSRLTYPNGATAEWDYEPTRDLLARVTNTINGTVASQYTYTNDLLGRRTAIAKS